MSTNIITEILTTQDPSRGAWFGSAELKAETLERMQRHFDADEIIRGTYWTMNEGKWRGCAVGCMVADLLLESGESSESIADIDLHENYIQYFNLPESLAQLEDRIFENCSAENAKSWPLEFIKAIPVGADLTHFDTTLKLWLLKNELHYDRAAYPQVAKAVQTVITLLERVIAGESPTDDEWSAAWAAAGAAARAAARAGAGAGARAAAWAAAWAATAAGSAARAAAWAAAGSGSGSGAGAGAGAGAWAATAAWAAAAAGAAAGAGSAAWDRIMLQTLEILRSSPVVTFALQPCCDARGSTMTPLPLTEFERQLLEQAAGHYTDYAIRILGVETEKHALFLIDALEVFINSKRNEDGNIAVYAALLGRLSFWVCEQFPLQHGWTSAQLLEREA